MIEYIKKIARKFKYPPLHKIDTDIPYVDLGDHPVTFPLLNETPNGALVYSFGVGEDIGFDRAAINTFNCKIHAFDPTPRSIEWLKTQSLPENFIFHQIGIGGSDEEVEFFPPENPDYVSFSISPSSENKNSAPVKSKVMRLESIITHLKTDIPDAVRMNVEGFEYPFVEDFVKSDIRPHQLIIEFHHGLYDIQKQQTLEAVKKLHEIGYRIFYISDHSRDYGFVYAPEKASN